jgi:hypothetical protein
MRLRQGGAALVALLLVACSETRNGPTPREMCRVLSEACGTETDAIIQCASVGQAGLKDPSAESHCYAIYDDCLPICQVPVVFDASVPSGDAGSQTSGAQASGEPSGEPTGNSGAGSSEPSQTGPEPSESTAATAASPSSGVVPDAG